MPLVRPYIVIGLIGLAAAATFAPHASAQQVYRIVGADGRVTFSDKPPADANAKLAPVAPQSTGSSGAALPFELRQVATKYPVTLYTSNNCVACGSGRAYLASRGVPFAEKTISSAEDAQALQRIAGENVVPLLTVGGQQIRGYSDTEWGQFLDAAGYPPKSVLPASWQNPPASPLVAVQRPLPPPDAAADASASASRNASPTVAPAPVERGNNPAGIKF